MKNAEQQAEQEIEELITKLLPASIIRLIKIRFKLDFGKISHQIMKISQKYVELKIEESKEKIDE